MNSTTSSAVLPSKGWLTSLTTEEREMFSSVGEIVNVEPQKMIIQENTPQPYFFFIISGMLSVRHGDAVVAVVCSGEFLGEMTIVTSGLASATVVSLEPCQLWRMSHTALMQFIDENKAIGIKILLALLSTVSSRLQAVNSDLADLLASRHKS